jgi:hypothetical protein
MKPVNLAAKLAALKPSWLASGFCSLRSGRPAGELRQERDDRRREAEMLCVAKLIAAKLREADERRVPSPKHRPGWRRLVA